MSCYITELIAPHFMTMTKKLYKDADPKPADLCKYYTGQSVHYVNDIHQAYRVLVWLLNRKNSLSIMGILKPLEPGRYRRMKILAREADPAKHVVLIDIDTSRTFGDWLKYPVFVLLELIAECLPGCFHGCSFGYFWSSSQGLKSGTRVHLVFWSREAVTGAELKRVFAEYPAVDSSVFSCVHPVYTAAPQFYGVEDPTRGNRTGFFQGSPDFVNVSIPPEKEEEKPVLISKPNKPYLRKDIIGAWKLLTSIHQALEMTNHKKVGDRYLRPGSESKVPGITITPNGKAWSFSTGCPLNTGKSADSLDVIRLCMFDGDSGQAYRYAAQFLGESA